MLSRTGPEEHRQRIESLVRRWLDERQSLITAWTSLQAAVAAATPLAAPLKAFCEVLMDYVSAGHFEVYDELLDAAERHHHLNPAAGRALLDRLRATTDAVIRFNDLCENPQAPDAHAALPRELPILGLELESRFQTEDRMIALLHDRVAQPAQADSGTSP